MAARLPKQASSATTSLIYITVGALTIVWTIIRYIYLNRHDGSDNAYLWTHGFLMSGIVLLIIGLAIGHIGRAARAAEVTDAPATIAAPVVQDQQVTQPVPPVTATQGTLPTTQVASPASPATATVAGVVPSSPQYSTVR